MWGATWRAVNPPGGPGRQCGYYSRLELWTLKLEKGNDPPRSAEGTESDLK